MGLFCSICLPSTYCSDIDGHLKIENKDEPAMRWYCKKDGCEDYKIVYIKNEKYYKSQGDTFRCQQCLLDEYWEKKRKE